jgi:fluoroquinolone resistance protein
MFEQQSFSDAQFKQLDGTLAMIKGIEFFDCTFERCRFTEAEFVSCKFIDCAFKDCDLSLARVVDTTFNAAEFVKCNLMGINWTLAQWGMMTGIHFKECTLNHGSFFGVNLTRCAFVQCIMRNVDFAEADLTGVDCRGSDFDESRFHQTDLTRADFTGAQAYAIDATANTLKQTRFSLPAAMALLHSLDIVLVED